MNLQSRNLRRMPAEWEHQQAILMAYPHEDTDWAYMLKEAQNCCYNIAKAIVESGESLLLIVPDGVESPKWDFAYTVINVPTNDTWTRDYGAISAYSDKGKAQVIDFKFNGWGLKFAADKDNRVTAKMEDLKIFAVPRVNQLSFALEGGSIESDGKGTILTTSECLLSPNRNGSDSKEEIEDTLRKQLGAECVLWLDHGYLSGDDTDSHIDTLARFVSEDTIVYVECTDTADEHYDDLKKMYEQLRTFRTKCGLHYKLMALPMPDAIYDADGARLPATYANFLILNNVVLMPTYNQPDKDAKAMAVLEQVFPDRKIKGVDCTALIQQHGSLHCATMQFPDGFLKI